MVINSCKRFSRANSTLIKLTVLAFFLFLHFVAAILLRSRRLCLFTKSSGDKSSNLTLLVPLDLGAGFGVEGDGSSLENEVVEEPEPIRCLILIFRPSLINCEVYA